MRRAALAAGFAALALVAACGDDVVDDADDDATAVVVVDGFAVSDAWTRPTPPGRTEAAIYLTIENRDAPGDRFIGSSSDECIVMQPHLTSIDDEDVASMVTAGGDQLGLPAGGALVLEPNGLHLMCLGLADPLELGDTFEVELQFAEHEPVAVPVVVDQR